MGKLRSERQAGMQSSVAIEYWAFLNHVESVLHGYILLAGWLEYPVYRYVATVSKKY